MKNNNGLKRNILIERKLITCWIATDDDRLKHCALKSALDERAAQHRPTPSTLCKLLFQIQPTL